MRYKCTLESKEKGYHHTQVLDVPSKHELIFGKKTWLEIARMIIENTVEVES